MIKIILEELEIKINNHIIYFKNFINKINSEKISLSLISNIKIKNHQNNILQNISNIFINDSNTLTITPYEKELLNLIYKSIIEKKFNNFNVIKLKNCIKITTSSMTQEKRKEIISYIHKELEIIKINIRKIRRDFNDKIKKLFKNKKIDKDSKIKFIKKIDNSIKSKIDFIEKIFIYKEKELLTI